MNAEEIKSIAVVGGGVSGIVAAYILDKKYQVTIFEKNDYLGGHANTRFVTEESGERLGIDTGFIVFNYKTYPNFVKFIRQLNVQEIDAPMTFGYQNRIKKIQYSSRIMDGIFADRINILRPYFLRMLWEIIIFNKQALYDMDHANLSGITLGEYVRKRKFSAAFQDYYLIPMAAAIWSSPKEKIMDFPCISFLKFYNNHGLLNINEMPQWKTIKGGSYNYVEAFKKVFRGKIKLNSAINKVIREAGQVKLLFNNGASGTFDAVIIAAHADQAFNLLADPDGTEKRVLGAWGYSANDTVLHSDPGVMPWSKRAWAAWNYFDASDVAQKVSLTYYMNLLQSLPSKKDYFVSLNISRMIDQSKIYYKTIYEHPVYNSVALASQKELPLLRPERRTFFCGGYCFNGFHEDAVRAACRVAEYFGASL